jgi:hypothetical protein
MDLVFTTQTAVIAIPIVIWMMIQAQNMGAPWMFTAFGILMIIVIAISVVRARLRR